MWYNAKFGATSRGARPARRRLRAAHGRIGQHEGTFSSGKAGARSSMQIRLQWRTVALISALAVCPTVVCASPQDQIAIIHDAQGRAVYVNAAAAPPETGSMRVDSREPSPDPSVHKLINQTAQSLEVDPKLVEAVVQVESGYNPRARSPKGAQGLMQLMPATAARFGVANPFDTAENIRGGVTYLGQLLKQFNGDVKLSLAAYNAGEGAVLRERGIPRFQETQGYVRRVTALYPSSPARQNTPLIQRQPASLNRLVNLALSADNAASPVPIYRYVDVQGVIHFSQ
jgi:Transglycosylase SLT domain